jgi:hypothetical protein
VRDFLEVGQKTGQLTQEAWGLESVYGNTIAIETDSRACGQRRRHAYPGIRSTWRVQLFVTLARYPAFNRLRTSSGRSFFVQPIAIASITHIASDTRKCIFASPRIV